MGLILSHLAPLARVPTNPFYNNIVGAAVTAGATPPSDRVFQLQNRLYRDLYSLGIPQKMDFMYNFTHDGSERFGYQNWGNVGTPTSYVPTKTGTLTHTSNDGLKGDGSTGYLNTGYSCSSNGVAFNPTDGFGLFSIVKETGLNSGFLIGRTQGTSHVWLRPRMGSNNTEARIVQDSPEALIVASGITDGSGLWYADRLGTLGNLYLRNSLLLTRNDIVNQSRPTGIVGLFARMASTSTVDNFTAATQRLVGLGGKLTIAQQQGLETAWNLYFSSL